MLYVLIAICGIVAGAISGVVGTGSSIILLPVLSLAFGPKAAIPIMAIASIAGNASRVLAWRRQINLRAFVWYSVAAVPAAVLGVRTLWIMPAEVSNLCIGLLTAAGTPRSKLKLLCSLRAAAPPRSPTLPLVL